MNTVSPSRQKQHQSDKRCTSLLGLQLNNDELRINYGRKLSFLLPMLLIRGSDAIANLSPETKAG